MWSILRLSSQKPVGLGLRQLGQGLGLMGLDLGLREGSLDYNTVASIYTEIVCQRFCNIFQVDTQIVCNILFNKFNHNSIVM